ncbi:sulfite exporter TauE/SafE family protein [Fulvivirga lutea]|uniref:Sulfite exporter TauE/SafE family protein n=1 Tax=Fulvivirga lutea TaxID=2810512 RepID=A0A974WFR7_9BACT|nr:sulfite exporter TauE/SafE family protein [Fulvivirga lutea]QSE96307.1 sulfite exporter TauE/SafE family protein [Fulvivirga lutea]
MIGYLIIGLTIGLFGGFHCIAMCGPVAAFLHSKSGTKLSMLLYNAGRLITYVFLGVVVGFVGVGIQFADWQSAVSVISGVALLLMIIVPKLANRLSGWSSANFVVSKFRTKLLSINRTKNSFTYLILGVINGLLPCGLVYMALIASLNGGGMLESILVMTGFGLGTWPLMSVVMLGSGFLNKQILFKRLVPSLSIIVGILLIVRGLSLDIPYVSPVLAQLGWDAGITTCTTP